MVLEATGLRIGRYKLLEKIGRAVLGGVYGRAIEPVVRRVASRSSRRGWTPTRWWRGSRPSARPWR